MTQDFARIMYRSCPLCESEQLVAHRQDSCHQHPLYKESLPAEMCWLRCTSCDHVFTSGYWSEEACAEIFKTANPHQLPGANLHGSRAIAARMVEKVLRQGVAPKKRWLDVGFGNGALLGTAEEYGFSVMGLDLREQAVARMKEWGIPAQVMRLEDYPGQADVISLADVLEHVPFPKQALKAAWQRLSPEGLLFLSMPNSDSYAWRALDAQGLNPYWGELEHYHNFGRRRLEALLLHCGFRVVEYGISERYYLGMEVISVPTHGHVLTKYTRDA